MYDFRILLKKHIFVGAQWQEVGMPSVGEQQSRSSELPAFLIPFESADYVFGKLYARQLLATFITACLQLLDVARLRLRLHCHRHHV
jgi:hypothetical protein